MKGFDEYTKHIVFVYLEDTVYQKLAEVYIMNIKLLSRPTFSDLLGQWIRAGRINEKTLSHARFAATNLETLWPQLEKSPEMGQIEVNREERLRLIRLVTSVGLILDHCGQFREATAFWSKWGPRLVVLAIQEVKANPALPSYEDFVDMRAKLWLISAWIQHCHSLRFISVEINEERYSLIETCKLCLNYANAHKMPVVKDPTRALLATLGRFHYLLGLLMADAGNTLEADECFQNALVHYRRRLEFATKDEDIAHFERAAYHRCAKVLVLGSGLSLLNRGLLQEARMSLSAADMYLHSSKDVVLVITRKLLGAYLQRALSAGIEPEKVKESIKTMKEIFSDLREAKLEHEFLLVRAYYEISVSHLHLEEIPQAHSYLKEAEKYSGYTDSWKPHFAILRSRLARRGDADGALRAANEALDTARKQARDTVLQEAQIVYGEALFANREYDKALGVFLKVVEASRDNVRRRAVALLNCARICVHRGETQQSKDYFEQWKQLKPLVQNGFIHKLSISVERLLDETCDFVLRREYGFNYHLHDKELRKYLMRQAMMKHPNSIEDAAAALGVTRQTFYNWRNALEAEGSSEQLGHPQSLVGATIAPLLH